ncbi:hypothetical protein GWK91_03495 [Virgibacillus sp. MSP4-1]|uniref:hypothetical protein n=1 Tax=Virgibacillus sp. MSP4-1 TaxID=2700081 RepID=UPI00039D9EC8|nr:hypothetical protein [Virgibacillus sp. MSP4-1]QHS22066.1 hypothetical protein GWK91_03495 [Virgibacillus sp. MSP4-1]
MSIMKMLLISIVIGIAVGYGSGYLLDGRFQPDFFVIFTIISFIAFLLREIKKDKQKETDHE